MSGGSFGNLDRQEHLVAEWPIKEMLARAERWAPEAPGTLFLAELVALVNETNQKFDALRDVLREIEYCESGDSTPEDVRALCEAWGAAPRPEGTGTALNDAAPGGDVSVRWR